MAREGIRFRRCRREDLYPAVRLILRSIGDLREKTGKPPVPWRPRAAPAFAHHLFSTDPETFLCAWKGTRLVGFAAAIVRGKQWYLAWLFVDPRLQERGMGREMLRRVWRDGPGMTHALGTFTYNQHAVGLYTSFGMLPHELLTVMEAKTEKILLPKRPAFDASSEVRRGDLAWIDRLERAIRGYPHPEEWRFWAGDEEFHVLVFRRGGRRVAYGMIGPRGEIQPIGVESARDLRAAVDASILAAAKLGKETLRFFCPNGNRAIYGYLHALGFRNVEMLVFMTDRPYGDFSRYLPATLAVF